MNSKRTTSADSAASAEVNLGDVSPADSAAIPVPRAAPARPGGTLDGLSSPGATPAAFDLAALHEAQRFVQELGVRFYQSGNRWVATNGADPDDVGQSDAYIELEVAPETLVEQVETNAGIQRVAPIEICHIQRGDAPPGTAHRLLTAVLSHARIVPTKISVIEEPTTRRLMRAPTEDFAAKIEQSLIVRMYARALQGLGLRPAQTLRQRDERGVAILVTYVDPFSIRRRLAAAAPK